MSRASADSLVSQSALVDALRFPLAVLVVFSHCVIIRDNVPASLSLSDDNIFLMAELFVRSLGSLAVAGFSLISGYYFFAKTETWSFEGYRIAVSKRIRTIVIPYVLWNLITIAAVWLKNQIALYAGFTPGVSESEIYLLSNSSLWDLLLLPFCGPLWYLRELFYLTLLSPIIYWAIRRLGYWSVLLAAIPYIFTGIVPIKVSALILFFFVLGAFLGMRGIAFMSLLHRYKWASVLSLCFYTIWVLFYNDLSLYNSIYNIILIPMLAAVVYWVGSCSRIGRVLHRLRSLSPSVFFIYAVHFILLINLVRDGLYYLGWDAIPHGKTIILFVTGVLVTLISYLLYRVMALVAPKVLAILCGGRAK